MAMISLPESDEELLAECDMDTFRSSGKGGQHVNKTESAVRLTHRPTGMVVTCQEERSQYLNKKRCLQKLREKAGQLNYRKPPRHKTREPRWVKEKVLDAKRRRSRIKSLRRSPSVTDD